MSDRLEPARRGGQGRSVRFRLLVIALLPTLVILPLLLGMAVYRWNAKFDAALISKVNGDLTIAHQYFARLLENTGERITALGDSARFRDIVEDGGDGLEALLEEHDARRRVAHRDEAEQGVVAHRIIVERFFQITTCSSRKCGAASRRGIAPRPPWRARSARSYTARKR